MSLKHTFAVGALALYVSTVMSLATSTGLIYTTGQSLVAQAVPGGCPPGQLRLLEAPDGSQWSCVTTGTRPLDLFEWYVSRIYRWIVGSAAGIAILWGVIGGASMIMYAGDQGKYSEGKQKLINSLIGLFIIIFSVMILNFLNPVAFAP